MADLTIYPREDLFESELASDITSSETSIVINDSPAFTLSSGGLYMSVDYDDEDMYEIVLITAISGSTLTCTRGVAIYEGGASSARAHSAGAKVRFSASWKDFDNIRTSLASKLDESAGVCTTPLTDATYASLAALQAAYASPTNGMSAYCTAEGKAYDGIGGAWVAREAGGTFANASPTVAGKVEKATSAQSIAGTDTGETGAQTFVGPADIAANLQNSAHVYAATAVGSDSYAITLAPAPAAYAAGQRFIFSADVANTGACTLDVNALGAKDIKKLHDQALEDGDIEAGSIVEVVYDGTNFQLQTPVATTLSTANTATLTGAGNAEALHTHTKTFVYNGTADFSGGVPAATTIAHGFGVAPKLVSAHTHCASAGTMTIAHGGFDGTNNRSTLSLVGSAYSSSQQNYAIYAGNAGGSWGYATITVDATNITLTWGRVAAGFNVALVYYLEAIA